MSFETKWYVLLECYLIANFRSFFLKNKRTSVVIVTFGCHQKKIKKWRLFYERYDMSYFPMSKQKIGLLKVPLESCGELIREKK
jgi:hypothetical protein